MSSIPNPSGRLQVDRGQIARQLELLGYTAGEKVFLRAFYPSDDPRKDGDPGRKDKATDIEAIAQYAENFQNEGRGVYFVVNGGGQLDKEVTACRAVFFEHDNLSKELQRTLWRKLGLPEPTFQIDTGGKSIHSYWVFDNPIDPEHWKDLQFDLLEFADADRANKNPSRVMRLAGCYHISAKGTHPTKIVSASGTRYRFEEIRQVVPKQKKPTAPVYSELPLQNAEAVPLNMCLSRSDRELIAGGSGEGSRNVSGAKLARNLLGTYLRLQCLGIEFSGDPRQLFDSYCDRCVPPLSAKEADQIWKSAERGNPTATLTDVAIENCAKAWRKDQQIPSVLQPPTKSVNVSVNGSIDPKIAELSLRDRIIEILGRGLKQSEEKQAFLDLSASLRMQPKEIETLAKILRDELEIEQFRDDRLQEIEELLEVGTKELDIAHFLPAKLATPITLWCKWLNIRPEVALTAVLTAISSLHAVGTELVIHRSQEFSVVPTLFSMVGADSGQKKSPLFKTIIRKPLGRLQREAKILHEKKMAEYTVELSDWEKDPSGSKPIKPGLPVFYFSDSTGEGLKSQAQECPNKALFALVDEITGLFNSANQYRGGKGSDRQDMLSYFDGSGQTVLRSSGIKVDVDQIYLSIFGGIQPQVLKELTGDLSDADGHWSRFLFVQQPLRAAIMDDDTGGINISELLTGCYRQVSEIEKREYSLSREAFKRYQKVYNRLEQKRVNDPQPGMRAVFAKMEGIVGRLALNLHVTELAVNGCVNGVNATEISLETMNKAVELAAFYISEVKAIHADAIADKGELSALLAKLLQAAIAAGRLSTRDAIRKVNTIKTTSQAIDLFRELEACGYGIVEKVKQSWVFIPIPKNKPEDNKKSVNAVNGAVNAVIDSSLPIHSMGSSQSVNGVNAVNDFSSFLNTEVGEDIIDTSMDELPIIEKKPEIIDTPDTIDTLAETPLQSGIPTVNDSIDSRPEIIDTSDTLAEPISLLQFENDGVDINGYVGCLIEVRSLSGKCNFTGKMGAFDEKNGVISVEMLTDDGKVEKRIASLRQSYIIG